MTAGDRQDPRDTLYTFRDYLREKLADDQWRREWAGEEALVRLAYQTFTTRSKRHLSQAALAKLVGTRQPNISAIENVEANPTLRTVGRLAAALSVDVSDLLKGEETGSVFIGSRQPREKHMYRQRKIGRPESRQQWTPRVRQRSRQRGVKASVEPPLALVA